MTLDASVLKVEGNSEILNEDTLDGKVHKHLIINFQNGKNAAFERVMICDRRRVQIQIFEAFPNRKATAVFADFTLITRPFYYC